MPDLRQGVDEERRDQRGEGEDVQHGDAIKCVSVKSNLVTVHHAALAVSQQLQVASEAGARRLSKQVVIMMIIGLAQPFAPACETTAGFAVFLTPPASATQ